MSGHAGRRGGNLFRWGRRLRDDLGRTYFGRWRKRFDGFRDDLRRADLGQRRERFELRRHRGLRMDLKNGDFRRQRETREINLWRAGGVLPLRRENHDLDWDLHKRRPVYEALDRGEQQRDSTGFEAKSVLAVRRCRRIA
jgi:hypothetical protein